MKKLPKLCDPDRKILKFDHKYFYELYIFVLKPLFSLERTALMIIFAKNHTIWIILCRFFTRSNIIQIKDLLIFRIYLLPQINSFPTFFKIFIISGNCKIRNGSDRFFSNSYYTQWAFQTSLVYKLLSLKTNVKIKWYVFSQKLLKSAWLK